jgi:hypothetical protein
MIKLVYDNWDNGKPIPNGEKNTIGLHKSYFQSGENTDINDLLTALKNDGYEIENIRLEDVDENALYIVYHHCLPKQLVGLDRWILSNEVEEKIRTKNLKILFLNLHESFDRMELQLKKLQNFIIKQNLPEENFYVLNNNSKLYDIKNKLQTKINVFKTNWLIEYMGLTNLKNIKIIANKKFLFLLHNRVPKSHRVSLLVLLKKFDLLKEDIIDWSLPYPQMPYLNPLCSTHLPSGLNLDSVRNVNKFFIDIHSKELRPIYKELITKPKLSYYENDKNWFDNIDDAHNSAYWNEVKTFEESYINIITESHYHEADTHISEKTYRPFYCFQLPIFLATHKHIAKLREEHPALHLFDDLINHSYDNEYDDTKRLEMVANEIKRLSENKNTIYNYYIQNETKLIENRNYIEAFINNKTTLNYFKSLINNDTI